MLLAAMDHFQ